MASQPSQPSRFSIGVDYGTNSVRAVVVDLADGSLIGESVYPYPTGDAGIIVDPRDPNLARQNPADYIQGFLTSVKRAVAAAKKASDSFSPDNVVGIGIDSTGSTPIPVDADGTALALHEEFRDDPAAHAWLWKDHTSTAEAEEITRLATEAPEQYLRKCGGIYSSEWYWAKILHCTRTAPRVAQAAASWVELVDFIPGYITGRVRPEDVPRSICAAGHKALYHEEWGGLPSADFLQKLHADLPRLRYSQRPQAANCAVGRLLPSIAKSVGLPSGIAVAGGAFDCHMGAIGCGVKPGVLVKAIGTSTCDIMVSPLDAPIADVPGVCGIVPESVLPGMYGIEAGQSGVGDIFNWFVRNLAPPQFATRNAHELLTQEAARLTPGASGLLALDWNNGNRCVLVDQELSGLLVGQTIHTTAPEIYRALIEATAFGALTIINRLEEYQVSVREVVCCGGIAEKSDLLLQIYADVCNRPIKVSRNPQTCALGAAICGAVAGGAYRTVPAAQKRMTGVKDKVYRPRKEAARTYAELFELYKKLHDSFGNTSQTLPLHDVMKRLIAIRKRTRAE
ncbi:MAG: ribulokinase [Planctomycetia bacterium]|nr:ribulokinase [Planctomycetia bacterium]